VRRALIGILTVCIMGLLGFNWRRAEQRADEMSKQTAPFDWSGVSSRDLNIAALFLTARDAGVSRAMDSLQALSIADTTFINDGHMIAHSLGRFAIANNHGNPSVLGQCRPTFQAGCYHGVLEGYLGSLPKVDAQATTRLCAALIKPDSARFPGIECAHGLGHGFVEAFSYKLDAALDACDLFTDPELKTECHHGVFMENMVHGLGGTGIHVGDGAMGAHMQMMSHAAPTLAAFRASDLKFPCDSVKSQYEASCWSYQPLVIASLTNYDLEKTIDACAQAPAPSQGSCYQGFGKQSLQWFSWVYPKVVSTCERAGNHADDCIAGGVEGLVNVTMDASRALALCSAAPDQRKVACYKYIGTRMALMRSTPAELARDCAAAPTQTFVEACIAGTRKG
jgi:hypothetical protein